MTSYFEPLDDKELHDHLRLQLPPTNARAGWYFDERAFLKAIDHLGIELPVRVRFMTSKYGNSHGGHYARKDYHRVTINQDRDLLDSNHTIWHELVHCMQAEDFAKRTGKPITDFHDEEYKVADGEWGRKYIDNAMEKQANRIAANAPFAIIQGG